MKKIKMAILGCGDRGNIYASYALRKPEEAEVVAVIDCDPTVLKTTGDKFRLPSERRFTSLDEFLKEEIECDTVVNATMDSMHYDTTKKLIAAGYDQLLEKPIVNNERELLELRALAKEKGVSILICHVLRYTPFYRTIKRYILEGKIGKILTLEMNEHVGTIHFADSFVRGKWSDEKVCGSGLLLQKCSHDMDLMCWLNNGTSPSAVSSFASRATFVEENAPKGATERCYECPHSKTCLYDATKIHLEIDCFPFQTWRGLNKPLTEITKEEKTEYLKTSDYGRCVYKLKRDLVDRQMVTVAFENGSLGTLNVVGGCSRPGRDIHIVGSRGEIRGRCEDNKFICYQCVREGNEYYTKETVVDLSAEIDETSGHSNGDVCLMHDYVRYLNGDDSSVSITSIEDSINGHECVYAAEKSRTEGILVKVNG